MLQNHYISYECFIEFAGDVIMVRHTMEVELVVDCQCHLGESPIWHPLEKRLYWMDILSGLVFVYNPAENEHRIIYQGEPVGGLTLQADGSLLFLMSEGKIAVWKENSLQIVAQIADPYEKGRRFNDAIADPTGRVYTGTLSPEDRTGRLYRIDTDGTATMIREGVIASNGMAFSPDLERLYHTETRAWKIHVFDYQQDTGELNNRRTFVDIPRDEKEGRADGLTIDSEGCLWSARYEGGVIVRYTPDGREERRVPVPARKVTSLAFGGENLEDLYITTAGGQDRSDDTFAGVLFRLRPGVRGLPEYLSRICL
jgi:D-xylonolactonase